MLHAVLNRSLKQQPTKQQLYGYLHPFLKDLKEMRFNSNLSFYINNYWGCYYYVIIFKGLEKLKILVLVKFKKKLKKKTYFFSFLNIKILLKFLCACDWSILLACQPIQGNLCLEVRESCSLYIHIYIFCFLRVFKNVLHIVLMNMNNFQTDLFDLSMGH